MHTFAWIYALGGHGVSCRCSSTRLTPSLTFQYSPQDICYFLHSLRATLRRFPNVCASITLPAHICTESWGGPGWIQKLGWLSDACLSLSAFTGMTMTWQPIFHFQSNILVGDLALSAMFPSHNGFVHIHTLPTPSTLAPPSDKSSTLRGLTSSGENNLAFKCMRKRLIFETLHLDLEGGVGERRTTPATTILDTTPAGQGHDHESNLAASAGSATIEIQVEQEAHIQQSVAHVVVMDVGQEVSQNKSTASTSTGKKPKQRKKVAFTSDRPDLYDF